MSSTLKRTCIVCKKNSTKDEFLRIVKNNDGINLDVDNKLFGRGAYICKNKQCIENCLKKKCLNRAFRCQVDASIYDKLKECQIED